MLFLPFLVLFSAFPPAAISLNNETDLLSLLAIKSVLEDPLGSLNSWNQTTHFCNWKGIRCGRRHPDRVVGISLRSQGLVGSLSPHVGDLSFLRDIFLRNNTFHSPIPQEMSLLRRLEFVKFSNNSFTGAIPSNLSRSLVYLNLVNNKLSGAIPTELGSMLKLEDLGLGRNKLSGTIPPSIGNLTSLIQLYLLSCGLNGEIPSSIAQMQRMEYLQLGDNGLSGTIPSGLFNLSAIQYFDVSSNQLDGVLPSTIGLTLPYLVGLYFEMNHITGYIPKKLGNLTRLRYLNLGSNSLSGELPEELGYLPNLEFFSASFNGLLNGSIPSSIFNISILTTLVLQSNQFTGILPPNMDRNKLEGTGLRVLDIGNNRIHGSFPFWTETLPQLRVLILRDNMFNGTLLPTSETQLPFPSLKVFDISHNAFTGSLPHKYLMNFRGMMDVMVNPTNEQNPFSSYELSVQLIWKGMERSVRITLTAFTTIDMSSNRFSGSIPNSIGILNSIISLNLSHNFLTGNIPASLGNVSSLESLDLSSNKLSGKIPAQLTKLTFLSVLDLSMNYLSGQIPQSGGQFPTFENSSYVGNSGLCGFPLTRKCEAPSPPMLQQEGDDSNFLDGFCWQAVVSGYGSGFVLGVSTGYVIFRYGRPKWFVDLVYRIYKMKRRSRENTARRRTRQTEKAETAVSRASFKTVIICWLNVECVLHS